MFALRSNSKKLQHKYDEKDSHYEADDSVSHALTSLEDRCLLEYSLFCPPTCDGAVKDIRVLTESSGLDELRGSQRGAT